MRSATPLDVAIIILFGGFATQPVLGQDRSLTNDFLVICAVARLHILISALKEIFSVLGSITEGTPVTVYRGKFDRLRLRQFRVQEKDVISEVHISGVRDMAKVEYVVVEHNGGSAIITREEKA